MKLPRGLSGRDLGKRLAILGYVFQRQSGSHMQYRSSREGGLLVTIPDHREVKAGTLRRILRRIGAHHGLSLDQLLEMLNG